MEKDLDIKLYNEYLDGNKEAFELLYNKYKEKIQYFIYNIVKDYQKAEDITQDTFVYVMQNKIKEGYTFKYYIYLVAKSRAYNYINTEKKRTEIKETYVLHEFNSIEQDVADIVTKNEKQKEIINAINMLEDRYKNTIYLTQIERLTYKETAQILGESVQNVRNLIHRGKKELRKILIKKGFDEMNKVSKVIIAILCISILLAGGVYATAKIVESFSGKAKMAPTFTSKISSIDTNKVWCGTFNLVWNDFMNDVIGEKIEFEDGPSELADELNKQTFTAKELNSNSYFKIHGKASFDLKDKIENGIKEKFNEDSKILDKVEWGNSEAYVLYSMLKKEFNYLEKFPTLKDNIFGDSEEKVKYFGIEPDTSQNASKNIEILFYNSEEDFAIKLKTKEGEEVYLYRTTGENKSFEENYKEMLEKQAKYPGNRNWNKNDVLNIPFIKINDEINYDELCGRWIKGTDWYIRQAIQTIDFELNNYGGSVKSETLIEALKNASKEELRTLGMGFRDKYIYETTKIIAEKQVDLESLKNKETKQAREELLKLNGVGPKVADCILLFSTLKRLDVFPIDVWVRRVMNDLYIHNEDETKVSKKQIENLAKEKFGELEGIAQQYLFYWRREN